jgi:hypothetical protein
MWNKVRAKQKTTSPKTHEICGLGFDTFGRNALYGEK